MPFPADKNTDTRFVTTAQALERWPTSAKTLYRRCEEGALTKHKKDGRTYWKVSELNKMFGKPPQPET